MRTQEIEIVRAADRSMAVSAVTAAFESDPVVRWMYPDKHQYHRNFPGFIRAFAGKSFDHRTAQSLDNLSAVALWLPPMVQPDELAIVEALRRSLPEEQLPEVAALMEQMAAFHPGEPHWYLPLIGVVPEAQGRGLGSALMEFGLAVCDEDNRPVYLEATNPRNVALYERFGFEPIGRIQTGTSPELIPMLRRPGATRFSFA